ncbi:MULTISPECIES: bifunctional tetrahydrofolate synthase/dihydrofolate synthase [Moraxella]|uniref:Dihydrofolate synthase/folylpolyglutamate synthase n=1 Tax=Moraxella lacunata TaxID=477 RepID=A0A1B8Q6H4_MORLA|nr:MULTISPECIES: bifunctional tetrahydrofolate synthase/dihydrofolate synthase [Moraxella]MBE9578771.1 bifunctional tetrahydrofolate synthase/dihydrofolate synthase [Moraxella sp. K1664]MBE9588083.1 bifunctional tetrahydrofolate synthase/dihydrofolate synthase [Moraxella sp. K1630]MBE9596175.1 bifunctional tetrahydrofolate synthase/dihydrofolate synthase [Moraxella sp. K2450]MDI4483771.1 bifunctional tetrahydrofolate synthase/dihydrofolate synthase [Moraxella lacunata]MDI4507402.1 bifunctional
MNHTALPQTISEWLNYMGNIHVSAIDMGLDRVLPVAQALGVLKDNLPQRPYVFTVAGTNGKGSTTALIGDICTQAGYKTALYQSPHLINFNERIKVDGVQIDDELLIKAFGKCEKARTDCHVSLSFFEMTTLSAFWIFKELKCDVWVLEIGLGGRLDVVNIINPDIGVITNIGIDHIEWLGDDREKIGFEKAGIIRDDMPVIYGEHDMPNSVSQIIHDKNAKCYHYDKGFIYQAHDKHWTYVNGAMTLDLPKPNIALINASNAISAILASKLTIGINDIENGLKNVKLSGRFDKRMINNKQWIFDVGHNTHGIQFLMDLFIPFWQTIKTNRPTAKLHFVFSMLADKDIDDVLAFISTFDLPICAWHIGKIDNVRAVAVDELYTKIATHLPNSTVYAHDSIAQAVASVETQAGHDDVILCFGSFHTIGESLIALGLANDPRTL